MRDCRGELPVSAKLDKSMKDFIDDQAAELGVSRSEMIRRLFVLYKASVEHDVECPHCGDTVVLDLQS